MGVENNIPEGWMETTLGDLVERITKGTTPKIFSSEKNDVNYIKSDALSYSGFLDNGRFVKISNETNNKLKRSQLKVDDILLSMAGEKLGKTGIIKEQHLPANTNQAVAIITVNKKRVGYKFIWYKLRNKNTVKYFKTIPSQSAQPNINFQEIRSLPINLPTLPEQKGIAKVLTAFDDKIELLQAQNKTLETIAQTIFKEWFGKCQIGDELPEGWRVGELGEIVTPHKGKNITKKQVIKGPYPVIAGGLNPSVFHNVCNTKSPVITVSASGANAGFVALHHHPVWSSDSTYIDISFTDYFYFIYVFLKSNQSLIYDKQEGSAIPHVYPRHLENLNLIIPTRSEMEKYEELAANIFHKISNNKSEIYTLSKTRDTLLPKLMSGQVRANNIKQTANA